MATAPIQSPYYEFTANPNNGLRPTTLGGLIQNFKSNFLLKEYDIAPGLSMNQYQIVKRVYFYQHNQFVSGPKDKAGNPKYFYDLITSRNDQSTKNIDLDTKDCYIKSETEGSYLKTWFLRREFMSYAKTSGFGMKLNELVDELPDFGTVVWKKVKYDGHTDVKPVELINLINDPGVKCLKDGIVIERHLMTQDDIYSKSQEVGGAWDKDEIGGLINSGRTVARVPYMDERGQNASANNFAGRIDDTTPFYEVHEFWGEIPLDLYNQYKNRGGKLRPKAIDGTAYADLPPVSSVTKSNKSVYVMAVVAGVGESGNECVLFCKEVPRDLFPYKEVHFRRRKGRWLGVGNYEQCFPLIEKANELTNRFFASLRIALLHLYQTRDQLHVKNVLTDLLDGDVVVSKSELQPIPTEIRGFTQYKEEMDRIEMQADKLCNSYEVVTGANLPSGTPWKLGNQQLQTANKLFEFIQENIGLFVETVFNEWLLPDFAAQLTEEHVLDLMDDMEDIQVYYEARRKIFQYEVLKRYILKYEQFPDPQQLQIVGALAKDSIAKGPKSVRVEKAYYSNLDFSVKMIVTGENDAKSQHLDTLSTTFQTIAANPAALQDPRLMKILNLILEQSGYSPLEINGVAETPTNPALNPANQGGGGADAAAAALAAGGGGSGGAPGVGSTVSKAAAVVPPGRARAGAGAY